MKLARRKFFGLMAVSPLAAKAASEKMAADLAGIRLGSSPGSYSHGMPQVAASGAQVSKASWRMALANADARKEIKSLMFEREKYVGSIEPDLASKRSFSLAAKIAYQRERNVEREMEALAKDWSWSRIESIGRKFIGI